MLFHINPDAEGHRHTHSAASHLFLANKLMSLYGTYGYWSPGAGFKWCKFIVHFHIVSWMWIFPSFAQSGELMVRFKLEPFALNILKHLSSVKRTMGITWARCQPIGNFPVMLRLQKATIAGIIWAWVISDVHFLTGTCGDSGQRYILVSDPQPF